MRKIRPWLLLLLALTSGGAAAYLALRYLRQQATPLMASEPRRGEVALATRDLPVGHVLGKEDIKVINWPGEAMPEGFISSNEAAVGRGVITPLRMNEPLLETKLASKDAGGGLPLAVGEGLRALSVRVDDVISVAGFVVPGTRVDVLLTMAGPGNGAETITKVILQNVQALAAGQSIQKDKDGKPQTVSVITVLVTPEQAEVLALAANQGRIQLALRNTMDTTRIVTDGARTSGLLGARPVPVAGPRPNRGPRVVADPTPRSAETVIEGYNGGVRTLLKF
jgi:pilus assembly protein CpaB